MALKWSLAGLGLTGLHRSEDLAGLIIVGLILFSAAWTGSRRWPWWPAQRVATAVPGVLEVSDLRARWLGHTIRAEVNVTVSDELSATQAHDTIVPVDPVSRSGEPHHEGVRRHDHTDLRIPTR